MKIRNKKTGEIKEINERELAAYGITLPLKKKSGKKKAQDGLTMPQEKDYVDPIAYQEALDAYWLEMGNLDALPDKYNLSKLPEALNLQTKTSRFQQVKNEMPSVQLAMQSAGRDLSKQNPLKAPKVKSNWGNLALGALALTDALIPEDKAPAPVVKPRNSYNQNQYGTGSQAIAKEGKKIKAQSGKKVKTDYFNTNKTAYVDSVLSANKNLDWVQRLYEKNPQTVQIPGQKELSTHYMGDNGQGYVFPTVVRENNDLKYLGDRAEDYARETNTGIQFPKEQGTWFANNGYKKGTKVLNGFEEGGSIPISNTGYKANSKDKNKSKLRIPSNRITMKNVPHPVIGTGSDGQQIIMMPEQEYLFPNAEYVDEQPLAKKGGKMGKKYVSKSYENGGELEVEDNQFTPISSETLLLSGPSHAKGGIDIAANGQRVNAEGGETIHRDSSGAVIVGGNLINPVTDNKFKHDFTMIAKKEAKTNKLMDYSTALVNNSNPYDKWESLKFNAGVAMMKGAKAKSKQLLESKEHLSELQEAMLQLEGEPQQMAENGLKMAQRGITVPGTNRQMSVGQYKKYMELQGSTPANGLIPATPPTGGKKQSVAQRHNNPGNIKFEKWLEKYGAVPGELDKITGDGTRYAQFPDLQSGITAMKTKLFDRPTYGNKTLEEAIKTWTGNVPYAQIPASIRNKKLNQMTPDEKELAFSTFTLGEDSKVYNNVGVTTGGTGGTPEKPRVVTPQIPYEGIQLKAPTFPIQTQQIPQIPQKGPSAPYEYDWTMEPIKDVPVGTDAEPLQFNQVLPEIYAAATNQEEPVWMQQYNPELFQDYQVSFQDRRNRITSQGRASRQYLQDNANAQAALAAQEYDAINNVDAEEFRINQGIAEDVTNKNKQLLNEAQLKNLQLADTQYVRQSTAKSKTKAANQTILDSVSNKVLENRLENRTLQVYENLYPHFRYDDKFSLKKEGNRGQDYLQVDPSLVDPNFAGGSTALKAATKQVYDKNNSLKSTTISTDPMKAAMDEERLKALKEVNLQRRTNSLKGTSRSAQFGLLPGINF